MHGGASKGWRACRLQPNRSRRRWPNGARRKRWSATGRTPAQKSTMQDLQAKVRDAAVRLGVPATFLAPKADLMEIALRGAAADVPLLRGWRREQLGGQLL